MLFRILKKDLKRKKVMNAILLCFILLATMFVASGISNVVSVMNGTDSYLDKAGKQPVSGGYPKRRSWPSG